MKSKNLILITLVIALLRKALPDIRIEAISVKFADSIDETKIATTIADKFNANHHIITIENFLEQLPKAISIIKMPFWDTHWYHMAKTAKNFSNYLVSGDGGDELFGGYELYKKVNWNSKETKNLSPYSQFNYKSYVVPTFNNLKIKRPP